MPRALLILAVSLTLAGAIKLHDAEPASALNVLKPVCGAAGLVSGLAGKVCNLAKNGGRVLGAGKKLLGGHVGGAVKTLLGGGGGGGAGAIASKATFLVGLAAVTGWVLAGAQTTLRLTSALLSRTTKPQLNSTWFSSLYWRIAGIGAVLTLPFLFAATVQALLRSDLSLLARSALGYLPLSLLVVSIAAPMTMLLLAITDGMAATVGSAARGASTHFLDFLGGVSVALSVGAKSPFVVFFVGLLVVAGTVLLWVELLMRDAAIYIVVLMLPLVFTAFVWPARRAWATRTVEILVALILSKFVIVAVLALGGATLGHTLSGSVDALIIGLVLVVLAALAPWALLRLLPMTEMASAAAGHLRTEAGLLPDRVAGSAERAGGAQDWIRELPSRFRQQDMATAADAGGSEGTWPWPRNPRPREEGSPARKPAAQAAGDLPSPDSDPVSTDSPISAVETFAGPDASAPEPGTRLPGLASMYQQADGEWEEITLGPEAFAPERPDNRSPASGTSGADAPTADDHNPLPPRQDPADGRL